MEENRCMGCMQEKQRHPVCEHCGFDENSQNDSHQLPVGTVLRNQYVIGRVLGQGGFGITYLGWDRNLRTAVAVKEFYPANVVSRNTSVSLDLGSYGAGREEFEISKQRFMKEGKALAKFADLQNIVRIHDFFPANNTVYLVMEYARGKTLQKTLKENGLMDLKTLVDLLGPMMEDLQKVHDQGIIHRDISPDNIMVLEGGGVKLLDFGAVRQVHDPDQEAQLSQSTRAILKQGFAPAEQYTARGSLGPWTDVYALCATLCYCLNGKLPQPSPERSISENPDECIDILPISEGQKQVFRRGMALRPRDRIASAGELLEELKKSLRAPDQKRSRQEKKEEKPRPEKKKKKHAVWLIPLLLAAVTAAAAFCLLYKPVLNRITELWEPVSREKITGTAEKMQTGTGALMALPESCMLKNPDPLGESEYAFGTELPKSSVLAIILLDSLEEAPADAVDLSQNGSGGVRLWIRQDVTGQYLVYIGGNGILRLPENSSYLFADFENVREIRFPRELDTSAVTDMTGLFQGCAHLGGLDLSGFDTGSVTGMSHMFDSCGARQVELRTMDTGNVEDMSYMFAACGMDVLDLRTLDTSHVKNMSHMFFGCRIKRLELTGMDVGQVTDMSHMFEMAGTKKLDLSGWNTASVTDMGCMFMGSQAEKILVTGWDTSSVTRMGFQFSQCENLRELDLSGLDMGSVTNMRSMFQGCFRLTRLDLTGIRVRDQANRLDMFLDCGRNLRVITTDAYIRAELHHNRATNGPA